MARNSKGKWREKNEKLKISEIEKNISISKKVNLKIIKESRTIKFTYNV